METIQSWFICVLVIFITSCQGSSVIVEKRQPTILQCTFPNNVTSVTWQLRNGGSTVILSNCSTVDNRCTDYVPSLYQGFSSNSGNNKIVALNVTSARTNETEFLCLADNGLQSNVIMEVYALPHVPVCYEEINKTFVDYTCNTTNVFPSVNAILRRIEKELTNGDFDPSYTECVRGDYGSGTEGDYRVSCHWRIPIENMLLTNTMFVDMTPVVSNMSTINIASVPSYPSLIKLSVPRVTLSDTECPIGLNVHDDSILIGTKAYCDCYIIHSGTPSGSLGWFTPDGRRVHTANQTDKNAYGEITYDYSEQPNQSYECRPITTLKADVTSVVYTPKFADTFMILEEGRPRNLECNFPNNVISIIWQMMHLSFTVNISTCNFVDNNCTNLWPSLYRGYISSSTIKNSMRLNILSVRRFETQFTCLADNGLKTNITQLEVYAWPKKPYCTQNVYDTYIEYMCTTDNVYPRVDAAIHRRGVDFTKEDFKYYNPTYSEGTLGEFSASLVWHVFIDKNIFEMIVYVEVNASVSNMSLINKVAVFSDDIVTKFRTPEVVVNKEQCPLGPGVHGETISRRITATCRCEIKSQGVPPGFARWFDRHGFYFGDEDKSDKSSTLSFQYDVFDPTATYECRGMSILEGNVSIARYTPKFASSAHHIAISAFQSQLIVLGAVCSGFVSTYT